MIDNEKIKKIRFAKREKEMEREIEKVKIEKEMELDALRKQVEKLQGKLTDTEKELTKSEISAEKALESVELINSEMLKEESKK